MERRWLISWSVIALSMLLLTGCSGSSDTGSANSMRSNKATSMEYAATDEIYETGEESAADNAAGENTDIKTEVVNSERKLIKNVSLNVETEDFDTLLSNVQNKITSLGGYVANLNSGESGGYEDSAYRYATISAKVPAEKVDGFVSEVSTISNVTSKNESVEDVTLQYVDLESHKKMLLAEQDSLLKLLESAESIEDIITIEGRLSEVRYQLESMEAQLRTFDNQVSYSEVTIYITEVSKLTPMEEETAWERISTGFMDNVFRVGKWIKNFLIEFVISLPILFVIAVIGVIIFLFARVIDKKSKARYTEMMEKRRLEHGKKVPQGTQNLSIENKNPDEKAIPDQPMSYGEYSAFRDKDK